jgi:hypothetical protein
MIVAEACYDEMINRIAREIRARVELYDGSTLLDTFTYDGALQSFSVERIGDSSKFFGYGICQKLTVKLRDPERAIHIVKGQGLEVVVGVGCEYLYTCPIFFVEDFKRNETTNEIEITAYDAIYRAVSHTVSEIALEAPYTIEALAAACASVIGMPIRFQNVSGAVFDTLYPTGANFEGTETIRDILDDIAEATGCIYYQCSQWCITFKRLDVEGAPVLEIDNTKYFNLTAKTSHTLEGITHSSELGDTVTVGDSTKGDHQYLRDNCLLDLRDDANAILTQTLAVVGGLTIPQFECKWRGNFLLEIGDKVGIITKDNEIIYAYILNDTISYKGGLIETTKWEYSTGNGENATSPAMVGESLKSTYARVNKQEKRIDLVASETSVNTAIISSLQTNTNGVTINVSELLKNVNANIESINDDVASLRKEVNAKVSSEDVTIAVRSELSSGSVNSIVTETGFTFNSEGLRVSKSGSEMESLLDEDGLSVFRDDVEVLTADNTGVSCLNVTANQYLIVGDSRFENYNGDRTGCFWIGG